MKARWLYVLLAAAAMAGPAAADWEPGMPHKWVQLPDLRYEPGIPPLGIDVNATDVYPPGPQPDGLARVLADDFPCKSLGPVTDIHIWGSWKNDFLPGGDARNVVFRLAIYDDVPPGMPHPLDPLGPITNYSRPGIPLWEQYFDLTRFTVRPYGTSTMEGWYDPATGVYQPQSDFTCWQYNFLIDAADAFVQQGTPEDEVTYWLSVDAIVPDLGGTAPQAEFGWKTSISHWQDDAVWRTDMMPPPAWNELWYPLGHPLYGESIDLAFAITPEPATVALLGAGLAGLALRRRRR